MAIRLSKSRVVLIILGLILLIPFPTPIFPDWTVRFVDEEGQAIKSVRARISCHHYSYSEENKCGDDTSISGEDGIVSFRGRSITLPLVVRAVVVPLNYLLLLAHGSVGPSTYLVISAPEGFESPAGVVNYREQEQAVILRRTLGR